MKIFVLYDKSGIHSGRVLGSYLIQHLTGKITVHRGRPMRLEKQIRTGHKYDYIVNVGWYREFSTGGAVVLNTPSAISLSSNKRKARQKFVADSIPAPKLWTTPTGIAQKNLPVIARTTHHTKGSGLWYCETVAQVNGASRAGATHYLKFIPNTREFRIHAMAPSSSLNNIEVDDYRIIKLSEKIPNPNAETSAIVKNHESGWFFSYPKNRKDPILNKIRDISREALAAFNLHWGAVDIMVSQDTGEIFVLEINSTPCLTDTHANTLEKYAKGICVLLGLEEATQRVKKKESPVTKEEPVIIRQKVVTSKKKHLSSFLGKYRF